jgi:rhodanese-related sulfurtransferase
MHTLRRRGSAPPEEVAASLRDYVVIDIRNDREYADGHIPGSSHVSIEELEDGWAPSDLRLPVAVLGNGDGDARAAAAIIIEHGGDAFAICGGAPAWRAAGRCFVKSAPPSPHH